MLKSKIVWRIVGIIFAVLVGMVINYFALPAWNIQSAGLWLFVLIEVIIAFVFQAAIEFFFDEEFTVTKIGAISTAVIVVAFIVCGLTGAKIFNASNYQKMVTIEEGDFEKDINPVQNVSNISIVDMETAESVGDRTVGSIENSAWYEVDNEYNLIKYQGQQYRISPLNYGGLFKFGEASKRGIPGYVLVNTQTQDAQYVELSEGMQYSPSAYWDKDLRRHLRGQYPSYVFGNHYFEIDEEGNPFWITSVKTSSIGVFGGKREDSFILTNAITGESDEYTVADLPEWVDHAFDLQYLMDVAGYNLEYKDGFWNSFTSQTGVLKTTYEFRSKKRDSDGDEKEDTPFAGYNTAITSDGDIVFYTGLTPASKAESNVGFLLANPRTGVIKKYTCSGAEESSAAASAESLVQDLKYVATFPTILNVNGNETYFMLLKDKAGLVQRYALCNVKNYTKVVQATTLEEAVEQYKKKLGVTTETANETEETLKAEGTIKNLYQAQLDGCTYYYFTLDDKTDLYMSSIKNSNKQVMLTEGTKVKIEYKDTSEKGVFAVTSIQF